MDTLKVCKYLREYGQISEDITVMVDEMYLQKCAQYKAGKLIGCDESCKFYKEIIVFTIQKLCASCCKGPITALDGKWLAKEMEECISALATHGFRVRAVVADKNDLCVQHPSNETLIYLFMITFI